MRKIKIFFLIGAVLLICSSNSFASTLNLGRDVFKLKAANFHSSQGDYININLGYGFDTYSAYGLEIVTAFKAKSESATIGLEYQFIPQDWRERRDKFNYALKFVGKSGNIFDESSVGAGVGFIIERKYEEKEIYFDINLVAGSTIIADTELGICAEFDKGFMGILSYKVVASDDEKFGSANGVNYGLKVDF